MSSYFSPMPIPNRHSIRAPVFGASPTRLRKKKKKSSRRKPIVHSITESPKEPVVELPILVSRSESPKPSVPPLKLPNLSNYYDQLRVLNEEGQKKLFPGSRRSKTYMVGQKAKLEYVDNYRNIDKILETNRHFNIEDSPVTSYLKKIREKHLSPIPMGIVKRAGKDQDIDIGMYAMGDSYAEALSEGMKEFEVNKLILSDNRLTDVGAMKILQGVKSSSLEILDLSNNKLSNDVVQYIADMSQKRNTSLHTIRLEGLHMKDVGASILCKALKNSLLLIELNLAKNNLEGCKAIAKLIELSTTLQKLDLHWNNIRGEGAKMICRAISHNKSLKILDLSWNAISSPPLDNACKFLSRAFQKHPLLFHVDLSHNGLSLNDAQVLSEGLAHNHTIMGIHMEGNQGIVDALGFVSPSKFDKPGQAHIFTRILSNSRITSHLNWRHVSNCWICERWNEVEFEWIGAAEDPVYIHFSFEGYEGELMQKIDSTTYKLVRMCPPGRFYYFYTHNSQIKNNPNQRVTELPCDYSREIELYPGCKIQVDICDANVKDNQKGPNLLSLEETSPKPRVPRRKFVPLVVKRAWGIPISIFKDYKFDDEELLRKCFEFDWERSKIPKLVKDPEEQTKVSKMLWEAYRVIKEVYKYYSSLSPQGEIWSIGQMVLTDLCNEAKIFDSNFRLADLDFHTKAALYTEIKNNPRNPANALIRYQFMEILVRISLDKFLKSGQATTASEAVYIMLNNHIKPNLSHILADKWRFSRYITEEVDNVLKANVSLLKAVYAKYSKLKVKPGQKPFMCLQEFDGICIEGQLLTETFTARETNMAFNLAMMTQPNELDYDRHLQMSFIEFLEAISRVADMAKLPDPESGERSTESAPLAKLITNLLPKLMELLPISIQKELKKKSDPQND
ncbi:unnamed protein product [Blepharisma stoltei]|uniref:Uncharacterized protein n=1 Tax=Blepharisma stoltei TaxID=1481888 RepID=A0AAU9J7B0_9CILI|nr:unnamed protein product [Blepharisma stoltei]